MKNTNPRAYVKLMMSTKGNSTDKCSCSSTASERNIALENFNEVLNQLKDKLEEVDLFEVL